MLIHATPDMAQDAAVGAERTGGAVAVSVVNLIVAGTQRSCTWHQVLTRVTGTGCLLGALTAACAAVSQDRFMAALAATTWLTVAGEIAAQRATGPGSFRVHLLDALDEVGQ